MDDNDTKMIEIVGIKDGERGRSCSMHRVCGESLCVGMYFRLRKVKIVNKSGVLEYTMAVNSMPDNSNEMCHVGFINRVFFEESVVLNGCVGKIVKIYNDADDLPLRRKMHMNKGVALAKVYLTQQAVFADAMMESEDEDEE